jgi:competence protein ComEA
MEQLVWWRQPRLLAAALCVALGLAVIVAGPLLRSTPTPSPMSAEPLTDPFAAELLEAPTPVAQEPTAVPPPPDVVVYISGAVAQPDVYRLPGGARVKDAVLAAGGLLADAAGEAINLAAPLNDAQHIHIPRVGEATPASAAYAPGAPAAADTPGASIPANDGRLDLNRASQADLEELPGIGKVLAERIVAYRTEHGAFGSVADLRSVSGIGAKLFAELEPLVVVP